MPTETQDKLSDRVLSALRNECLADESGELRVLEKCNANDIEDLRGYLSRPSQLFSHSNRLNDGRNTSLLLANYATEGDITAESLGCDGTLDIAGNAGDAQYRKVLLGEYEIAGCVTTLLDAIMTQRLAGKWLCKNGEICFSPSASAAQVTHFDKFVLAPFASDYIALAPTTPAFRYPSLYQALSDVFSEVAQADIADLAEEKQEQITNKTGETPSKKDVLMGLTNKTLASKVRFRARAYDIPKPVNLSQRTSDAGGRVIQPLFTPPIPKLLTQKEWSISLFENGELPSFALKRIVEIAKESANLFAALSFQRHKHKLNKSDPQVENAASQQAYANFGRFTASVLKDVIAECKRHALSPQQERIVDNITPSNDESGVYQSLENIGFQSISSRYRISDDRNAFKKGFQEGLYDEASLSPVETRKHNKPTRGLKGKSEGQEGRFLRVSLRAEDVDLGTTHISAGALSLTALHGLLHNVLERQCGLTMRRFLPSFDTVGLKDGSHKEIGIEALMFGNQVSDVYSRDQGDVENTRFEPSIKILSGARSCRAGTTGITNKPLAPPLCSDIKGFLSMGILVELDASIAADEALSAAESLAAKFKQARLAGGEIVSADVSVRSEPRMTHGYLLSRVYPAFDESPLHTVFRSVAFGQHGYLGEVPLGAVHTGYQSLGLPVDSAILKQQAFDVHRVEPTYHLFRYVHAKSVLLEEVEWFSYRAEKINDHFNISVYH